jgi:hypothetical protein
MKQTNLTISDGNGFTSISELMLYYDNNYEFQQTRDLDRLYSEQLTNTLLDDTCFTTLGGFSFLCGALTLKDNKWIKHLEGIRTSKITSIFFDNQPELIHFPTISPELPKGLLKVRSNPGFTGGLLSAFKLLQLKEINHLNSALSTPGSYVAACNIINRYLVSDDRDMLDCKEELMTAGLKEYGRL